MYTVPLPPGVNPIAVDKYIISYITDNLFAIFRMEFFRAFEVPKFTNKTMSFNNIFKKNSQFYPIVFLCLTFLWPHKTFKPINSYSIRVSMATALVQSARKALMSGLPVVWQPIDTLSKKCVNSHYFDVTSPHCQTDLMSIYLSDTKKCTRVRLEGSARPLGLTLGWAPVSLFRRGPIIPAYPISHRWYE